MYLGLYILYLLGRLPFTTTWGTSRPTSSNGIAMKSTAQTEKNTFFLEMSALEAEYFAVATKNYYRDKTLLTEDFIERYEEALAIVGPSRYGKTVTVNMYAAFLGITVDRYGNVSEKTKTKAYHFFKSKEIGRCKYFNTHFKSYVVLHMDFKTLGLFTDFDTFLVSMNNLLTETFAPHDYLITSSCLEKSIRRRNANFFKQCTGGTQSNWTNLAYCGKALSMMLSDFHHKKVLVLIDEISAPFQCMLTTLPSVYMNYSKDNGGLLDNIVQLLGMFAGNLLKSNIYVWRSYLTGLMRFGETYTLYANNLVYESVFERKNTAINIGFTETDIKELGSLYNLSNDEKDDLKLSFDGYRVYNRAVYSESLYSPGYVIKYLTQALRSRLSLDIAENYCPTTTLSQFRNLLSPANLGNEVLKSLKTPEYIQIPRIEKLTLELLIALRRGEIDNCASDRRVSVSFFHYLLEMGFYTARWDGDRYYLDVPNQVTHLTLQKTITDTKYYKDYFGTTEIEIANFRRNMLALDGTLETLKLLIQSIAKLFWATLMKTPDREVELAGPLYAFLAQKGKPYEIHNELYKQIPENYTVIKRRFRKVSYQKKRGLTVDLFILTPDGTAIILDEKHDGLEKSGNPTSSPEEALQYVLDQGYVKFLEDYNYTNYILLGLHMNTTHCGGCLLFNSQNFENDTVCYSLSKDQVTKL